MTSHAAPTLDDLARALDRARARHGRRPDDPAAYVALLEAQVAYLSAELAALNRRAGREVARERSRSAEIGRRLKAIVERPAGGRGRRRGGGVSGQGDRAGQMEMAV